MAVPKRKTSPSKRGMRRSADALTAPTYIEDKNSGELRRPHHIDLKTGMYRGKQILTVRKTPDPFRPAPRAGAADMKKGRSPRAPALFHG